MAIPTTSREILNPFPDNFRIVDHPEDRQTSQYKCVGTNPTDEPITVAVGTTIADRPRTDPYERVYAYGSYEG